MRIFEHPNMNGEWACPICGTDDNKPVTLVAIEGTEEGGVCEAVQTHIECINLRWYKEQGFLIQQITRRKHG